MNYSFYWIITGFILIIIETILPMAYFLWFGTSCFILSIITYFFNFIDVWQVVIYALITPFIVIFGRRFVPIHIEDKHDRNINKKLHSLIGRKIILTDDLNKKLQMKIDETYWTLEGDNLKKGSVVTIYDVDNNRLLVRDADGE